MPRFKKLGTGELVPFTPEEEAAFDARDAQWEVEAVEIAKANRVEEIKAEAITRIDAKFEDRGTEDLARYMIFLRRETKGTATAQQLAFLDAVDSAGAEIVAIRSAAKTAVTAVNAASTVAEVEAVAVAWPA